MGRVYYLRLFLMYMLHIILLTCDKLLLHISQTNIHDETRLLLECELMYEYAHKYKPIRRLETVVLHQNDELDFFVKKYMKCYGIDNVRGGTYTDVELSIHDKQCIERELTTTLTLMQNKSSIMNMIIDKYSGNISFDELKTEFDKATKQQMLYDNETQMLCHLTRGRNIQFVSKIFLADLQWILNECVKTAIQPHDIKSNKENITKYRQILNKMKEFYTIFCEYLDIDIKYEPRIHLYAPEVILDVFFYHSHNERSWDIYTEQLVKLIEYYEYIFYCVKCRVDEYAFDITTYPPDFEMVNQYKLKYLQQLLTIHSNGCHGIV